jgi:hypothetical protein
MKTYILSHDDIRFITGQVLALRDNKEMEFNAETVAEEIFSSMLVCSIRNEDVKHNVDLHINADNGTKGNRVEVDESGWFTMEE